MKINGHRVELSEIESAIKDVLQVKQVVLATRGKNNALCAYLQTDPLSITETVQQTLALRLPEHMVPRCFIAVSEFPITTNGKINIAALPEPQEAFAEEVVIVKPQNGIESKLVDIFKEVLGRNEVGTDQIFQYRRSLAFGNTDAFAHQ